MKELKKFKAHVESILQNLDESTHDLKKEIANYHSNIADLPLESKLKLEQATAVIRQKLSEIEDVLNEE